MADKKLTLTASILVLAGLLGVGIWGSQHRENAESEQTVLEQTMIEKTEVQESQPQETEQEIPAYEGNPYTVVQDNQPSFNQADLQRDVFEAYSELDALGRCGVAFAMIGTELMPDAEREEIGAIRPSGWHTVKYNDLIEGNYLYNRCHLIAYQLAGENANEKNLITGTRYLNVQGMEPFEQQVGDYVKRTQNHVLYRVTPVFTNENLVADGVLMEAMSVEDAGAGICFNVFVHNVQPGVLIDYQTGESQLDPTYEKTDEVDFSNADYILNTRSMKFHKPECDSVKEMSQRNKQAFEGTREEAVECGYEPCMRCNP